jgi:hypothetical protein
MGGQGSKSEQGDKENEVAYHGWFTVGI